MSDHPLIYVDLIEETPQTLNEFVADREKYVSTRWADHHSAYTQYINRFQPWRWVALSGGNHEPLAVSSEAYFNEADAHHAVELLFGSQSNVYLRQKEHSNVALRLAAP